MRITIRQFQQLHDAAQYDLSALDQSILMVKILTGKTDFEIEKMKVSQFNKICADIKKAFDTFNNKIDTEKPKKLVRVKGKTYLIHYEINKLNAGRYVEVSTFSKDVIGNLHKIMASIVTPMKLTWKGLKAEKYDANNHSKIADDLLDMDFSVAYHACVFFYAVFQNLIKTLPIYGNPLEVKVMGALQNHLANYLDGTITANWYRNLKTLN